MNIKINIFAFLSIILLYAFICCLALNKHDSYIIEQKTYYDGEGNLLPDSAVRLLVLSQYTNDLRPSERDTLKKYFYYRQNLK